MSECEGNNPDCIVTAEIGVGMSARQLQDLLTNAFSKFQAECSNLRSDLFNHY